MKVVIDLPSVKMAKMYGREQTEQHYGVHLSAKDVFLASSDTMSCITGAQFQGDAVV